MKKAYIEAYLFNNLGDDLFVKILTERYKNVKFYAQTRANYKKSTFNKNLTIYSGILIGMSNLFFEKILGKYNYVGQKLKDKSEYMVSIGGSIFMEKDNFTKVERQFALYDSSKPIYILGANFGPYKTKKYKDYITTILKNAKDISFRDKESYNEFKDLDKIRFNSDIVFGLDLSNIKIETRKNVIISVIDCELKGLNDKKQPYEDLIVKLTENLVSMGYEVTLMSFCKKQGDEKVVKSLLKRFDDKYKKNIHKYFYRNNIEEALDTIAKSEIVIGTRFHANILGLLMKKKVLPIAYSDKTINVLKDMNFEGSIIDIRNIENFNIKDFDVNKMKKEEKLDEFIRSSKLHFSELDKVLDSKVTLNAEKE